MKFGSLSVYIEENEMNGTFSKLVTRILNKKMEFLFRPVHIASLVFFRIVFGILAFADVVGVFSYYHLYKGVFDADAFHFHYFGFEWLNPLPEPFMSLFFISLILASIFIVLGKWYHLSTAWFALGFTWLFLLEKTQYLNHGYLFCWLSFVMIFLPAQRWFSLDAQRNPSIRTTEIPFWSLAILPLLMGIVYFFGGIAKINPDWLQAMPIKLWLRAKADYWIIGPLISKEPVAWFMAYGGLILDLTAAFFMLGKKTRKYAFVAVVFFHCCNLLVFNIGIFPWLSVALTALFFPADFPLTIIERFKTGTSKLSGFITKNIILKFKTLPVSSNAELWQAAPRWKPVIVTILTIILLVHLSLPLRHHFFEDNVVWTEEGHRYAWRMMLRSKRGYGTFRVADALTGKTVKVLPEDYLTKRQNRNIYTHPDMIWEFAQFLAKTHRDKGWEPRVYADVFCSVNGSNYFRFVDKQVDLAVEPWHFFKHSDWIIPLGNYRNDK